MLCIGGLNGEQRIPLLPPKLIDLLSQIMFKGGPGDFFLNNPENAATTTIILQQCHCSLWAMAECDRLKHLHRLLALMLVLLQYRIHFVSVGANGGL